MDVMIVFRRFCRDDHFRRDAGTACHVMVNDFPEAGWEVVCEVDGAASPDQLRIEIVYFFPQPCQDP